MKKNSQKISIIINFKSDEISIPYYSRINCATLSKGNCNFFACGDDSKTIYLFNNEIKEPIQVF